MPPGNGFDMTPIFRNRLLESSYRRSPGELDQGRVLAYPVILHIRLGVADVEVFIAGTIIIQLPFPPLLNLAPQARINSSL
jgi:hypothetical protein